MKKLMTVIIGLCFFFGGLQVYAEAKDPFMTIKTTPNEYYTVLMLEDCEGDPTVWGSTNMDLRENSTNAKQGKYSFHTKTEMDYCIVWRDMEMRECPVSMENGALEFWVKVSNINKLRDGSFVAELWTLDGGIAQWWISVGKLEDNLLPANLWVRVTLPFAQTSCSYFSEFDPESITRFRFIAFNEDFRGNEIFIDDVKIVDMTRKPNGSPIKGPAVSSAAPVSSSAPQPVSQVSQSVPEVSSEETPSEEPLPDESLAESSVISFEESTDVSSHTPAISDPEKSFPWVIVIPVAVLVVAGGGTTLWYFVIRKRLPKKENN